MPGLNDMPSVCQVRNTKAISIHIRTLATPGFNYAQSLSMARMIYANIGVAFNVMSELCPSTSSATTDLSIIDGTCQWNQFNTEQTDLYASASPGASGVTVFIVGGIRKPTGDTLAGCAGHAPGMPAAVVSAASGTIYTIAHEVGHVLLGSAYSPVHSADTSNIMVSGTWRIPAGAIPYFSEHQRQQILQSPLLRSL